MIAAADIGGHTLTVGTAGSPKTFSPGVYTLLNYGTTTMYLSGAAIGQVSAVDNLGNGQATFYLTAAQTVDAPVTIDAGSTVNVLGNLTLNAALTNNGTLNVGSAGGYVTLTENAALTNAGTATMYLANATTSSVFDNLTNDGMVEISTRQNVP